MSELVVILGAGQIGTRLAAILARKGQRVRLVKKSASDVDVRGVEVARGDLTDPTFAAEVGRGASVVYQCTNPIYTAWPKELLPLTEGAIAAANASQAKLVVLDCLYSYGKTSPMREESPMNPCSKKGELRRQMAERYQAGRARGLRVSLVRASDFIGADMQQTIFTADRNVERWLSGRGIEVFGSPDQPHAYTYGEDVARALARTAELDDAPFVLFAPTLPARPTREVIAAIAARVGHSGAVSVVPRWLLQTLGVVWPLAREGAEMVYEWEMPFVLDDAMSRRVLGLEPTSFDEQIATVARSIVARREAKARTAELTL